MGRRQKLQDLCETRWPARAGSLNTFRICFSVVVESLENLSNDGDSKALDRLRGICRFNFILPLVVAENLLQQTVPLSNLLQAENFDLIKATEEAEIVIATLQAKRNDDDAWLTLFNKATEMADAVGEEPSRPRVAGRQQHRNNVMVDSIEQYWRRACFLPLLDHLVQQLTERLIQHKDRFHAQYLMPTKLQELTREKINIICEAYSFISLDLENDLEPEIERWQVKWRGQEASDCPTSIGDTLSETNNILYPNIYTILKILLTMPVTSATAERSFSALKRIKSTLRTTMTDERLSSLPLLHVHRDIDVEVDNVIDTFKEYKDRKWSL